MDGKKPGKNSSDEEKKRGRPSKKITESTKADILRVIKEKHITTGGKTGVNAVRRHMKSYYHSGLDTFIKKSIAEYKRSLTVDTYRDLPDALDISSDSSIDGDAVPGPSSNRDRDTPPLDDIIPDGTNNTPGLQPMPILRPGLLPGFRPTRAPRPIAGFVPTPVLPTTPSLMPGLAPTPGLIQPPAPVPPITQRVTRSQARELLEINTRQFSQNDFWAALRLRRVIKKQEHEKKIKL